MHIKQIVADISTIHADCLLSLIIQGFMLCAYNSSHVRVFCGSSNLII